MDVAHKYSGILLSHKKECSWVSSSEMDEPGAYYTELSKSEREKHDPKGYMHLNVHCSIVYNSQDMEAT